MNLLIGTLNEEIVVRRMILLALPLALCLGWGLGCGNYDPPPLEERPNPMKQKNIGEKEKKKGILAEP